MKHTWWQEVLEQCFDIGHLDLRDSRPIKFCSLAKGEVRAHVRRMEQKIDLQALVTDNGLLFPHNRIGPSRMEAVKAVDLVVGSLSLCAEADGDDFVGLCRPLC